MKYNLVFCYILVAAAAVSATDYCNMTCTVDGLERQHIACETSAGLRSWCPEDVELINITKSLQNFIVHKSNVHRDSTAGGENFFHNSKSACRMATIQWDEELAKHAALHAKRCTKRNDYCHTTDSIRSSGQDIYQGEAELTATAEQVIEYTLDQWYSSSYTISYNGDLMADDNTRVGCAMTWSHIPSVAYGSKTYWMVCNYAVDSANRESVYEICESSGEKCKNKPTAPFPNLCAVGETYQ